jgi:hypothetical protein
MKEAAWQEIAKRQHLKFDITDDPEEAREIVSDLLAKGEKPLLTAALKYLDTIQTNGIGLTAQKDVLSKAGGYSITAARLGADPYLTDDEERLLMEINPEGLKIVPRFTGDGSFSGTIAIENHIPPEKIEIKGTYTKSSYEAEQEAPPAALAAK